MQTNKKKHHRKVLLSNFHLNREIRLRKNEPPCKLLELNLNCLIGVQSVRQFKTLTASAYYISVFSIEFKKIGVEDVTLSLKTDGSIFFKYYYASFCECLKNVM